MGKGFYNTIHAEKQMLMNFEATTKLQKDRVLEIFQLNSYRTLTTREALTIYITKWGGITNDVTETLHGSIKRSITDLTDELELIKCPKEEMVPGQYGKPVYTWQLNKKQ